MDGVLAILQNRPVFKKSSEFMESYNFLERLGQPASRFYIERNEISLRLNAVYP
jgi:hypothetical protein